MRADLSTNPAIVIIERNLLERAREKSFQAGGILRYAATLRHAEQSSKIAIVEVPIRARVASVSVKRRRTRAGEPLIRAMHAFVSRTGGLRKPFE